MAALHGRVYFGSTVAGPPRSEYALGFSSGTERRLRRCRASLRAAIHDRLLAIALEAAQPSRRPKPVARAGRKEPPLRFYVYEGYRVVYQVDDQTRRVVVLDLAPVSA